VVEVKQEVKEDDAEGEVRNADKQRVEPTKRRRSEGKGKSKSERPDDWEEVRVGP
jgi:hypothetical protein